MRTILKSLLCFILLFAFTVLHAEKDEGCWDRKDMRECSQMGYRKKMGYTGKKKNFAKKIIHMQEKLGLTDEQVESIRKIQNEMEHFRIDKKDELRALKLQLKKLSDDENTPLEKLKEIILKIHQAKAELQFKNVEVKRNILSLLTSKEKAKLKEIMEERKECLKKGKHKKSGKSRYKR